MKRMYFGGIKGENSIEIRVLDVQYSNNGEKCKNKCQKDGASYNWCYTGSESWDYCTPLALGKKYREICDEGYLFSLPRFLHFWKPPRIIKFWLFLAIFPHFDHWKIGADFPVISCGESHIQPSQF